MIRAIKNNIYTIFYFFLPFIIAALLTGFLTDWNKFILLFTEFSSKKTMQAVKYALVFSIDIIIFINGCRVFFNIIRNKSFDNSLSLNERVFVIDGSVGKGKSSSQSYICEYMAEMQWDYVQDRYFILASIKPYILKGKDPEKILELMEIESTYNFFKEHENEYTPCLASNQCLIDRYGRKCYNIEKDHILMKKKLPSYLIISYEEMGTDFAATKNPKGEEIQEMKLLDEFASFLRQYLQSIFIANDQAAEGIAIAFRRIVTRNNYMLDQVPLMKPKILQFVYNITLSIFSRKMKLKYGVGMFLYRLDKFIDKIGFRKYTYMDILGNSQKGIVLHKKKKTFILPSKLNCKYSSRAFMGNYPKLMNEIEIQGHQTIVNLTTEVEEYIEKYTKNNTEKEKK
jgi:hypothetical protein